VFFYHSYPTYLPCSALTDSPHHSPPHPPTPPHHPPQSLVLSSAALTRRTPGEISNLMAVDSTRMQEVTPYGHAVWYSLYQVHCS
jgi:hypothetical protein